MSSVPDPNFTKKDVISQLLEGLSLAMEESNHRFRDSIIKQHAEMFPHIGGIDIGFVYKGKYYSPKKPFEVRRIHRPTLDDSLWDKAQQLEDAYQSLSQDNQRIRQAFYLLLKDCQTPQDIRDAIPDALRSFLPAYANLSRTRPPAYTLEDDPQRMATFTEAMELVYYHLSMKMLA